MHAINLQPRGRKAVSTGTATGRKALTAVTAITQVTPEDQTQPKTYTATVVKRFEARAEVTFSAVGSVNTWDLSEALKGRLTDADFGTPVAVGDIWVDRVEEAEPGEKSAGRDLATKSDGGDDNAAAELEDARAYIRMFPEEEVIAGAVAMFGSDSAEVEGDSVILVNGEDRVPLSDADLVRLVFEQLNPST